MDRTAPRCRRIAAAILAGGLILALIPVRAGALGQEFIPLENWSYDAVERFEALGLCVVPEDRPLTRTEFTELVDQLTRNAFDRRLSPRDRYNLERLEKEFTNFASRGDAQHRYDPPTFYLQDTPVTLEGDVDIIGAMERVATGDDTELFIRSNPDFKVHYGNRLTYNVRHRWEYGPEHEGRRDGQRPDPRRRSFRGLTSEFERSYVIAAWEKAHVFIGREAVDWGPADWGNLITPGAAHTLDQIGFRLRLKMFRLSAFHARLSPLSERYLAGHRLEIRLGNTILGLSETALYAGKGMESIYSFPLASFYGNQFNERSNDDNITWAFDVKSRVFDRVVLYGGVLIDDFQYEREGDPDKLAFDVGARAAFQTPVPVTVRGRYRYVDIFTYTHFDSLTRYLSGEADPSRGDVVLGGAPGPDSDVWNLEVEWFPRRNAVVTVEAFGQRVGAGNDFRAHVKGEEPDPEFPLPVVERTMGYSGSLTWEFDRNRYAVGEVGWEKVENIGHVSGADDDGVSFRLAIHWEFL